MTPLETINNEAVVQSYEQSVKQEHHERSRVIRAANPDLTELFDEVDREHGIKA